MKTLPLLLIVAFNTGTTKTLNWRQQNLSSVMVLIVSVLSFVIRFQDSVETLWRCIVYCFLAPASEILHGVDLSPTFYMSNRRDVLSAISEGLNIRTALRAVPSSSRLQYWMATFSWGLTVGTYIHSPLLTICKQASLCKGMYSKQLVNCLAKMGNLSQDPDISCLSVLYKA